MIHPKMEAALSNPLIETVNNIYRYFGIGFDDINIDDYSIFRQPGISRHNPNKCDLCFPLSVFNVIDAYVSSDVIFPEVKSKTPIINIAKVMVELPVISEEWSLPVKSCSSSSGDYLCILLDRNKSFLRTMRRLLCKSSTPKQSTIVKITIDSALKDLGGTDLTQLRTILAYQSLLNVFGSVGYEVETCCDDQKEEITSQKIHVCYKSQCSEKKPGWTLIYCGPVLDSSTKVKASEISPKDYYSLKKSIFENVALRRESHQDDVSNAKYLSEAEVTAKLLWPKLHNKMMVHLSEDPGENGVSRGATLLLYNHVRLIHIRKEFEKQVECGKYPQLPPIDTVDFGLLNQNEEWELLLLILQFPYWLVACMSYKRKVSLHPLLIGLDKLCRVFSAYYRRVRVLTEPRPHLLPVMYARLYLLQCLESALGKGLSIFNMKTLEYM